MARRTACPLRLALVLLVEAVVLVIITLVPETTVWLPRAFGF